MTAVVSGDGPQKLEPGQITLISPEKQFQATARLAVEVFDQTGAYIGTLEIDAATEDGKARDALCSFAVRIREEPERRGYLERVRAGLA